MKTCNEINCQNGVFGGGFCAWHQHKSPVKRAPIKKQSEKLKTALSQYTKDKKEFMQAHPNCAMPGCSKPSTDLHHMKGRGKDLLAKEYWKALCRGCHDWATENSKAAIEMGVSVSRLKKAS